MPARPTRDCQANQGPAFRTSASRRAALAHCDCQKIPFFPVQASQFPSPLCIIIPQLPGRAFRPFAFRTPSLLRPDKATRGFACVWAARRVTQSLFTLSSRRIPGSSTRQRSVEPRLDFGRPQETRDSRRVVAAAGWLVATSNGHNARFSRCASGGVKFPHLTLAATASASLSADSETIPQHIDIPVSTRTEHNPLSLSIVRVFSERAVSHLHKPLSPS